MFVKPLPFGPPPDWSSALLRTVWAVNPENDNLDALETIFAKWQHLCEHAQLACRLSVSDLPGQRPGVQPVEETHIIMTVRKLFTMQIKHSKATEITLQAEFEEGCY